MKDAEDRFIAVAVSAVLHIFALGLLLILRFPTGTLDHHPKGFSVIPLIAPTERAVAIGGPAAARLKNRTD